MSHKFRNLIFEGGGVKGIGYVGAMEVIEKKGVLSGIERVGGTSAGAINALMISLKYSNEEVREILEALQFTNFMDDSWGVVRDINRLQSDYGWYKGDYFKEWIGKLIERKSGNANLTFKGLKEHTNNYLDLYVCSTNLSTHFTEVFSAEHTPRMRIADAVRMSMSIPLFFAAVKQNMGNDIYVDGGVLRNYPIRLFDREKYIVKADQKKYSAPTDYYRAATNSLRAKHSKGSAYVLNKQTLGFRLDSKAEIGMFRDGAEPKSHNIDSFFDYAFHLIQTLMDAELNRHLESEDWKRTIYIDTLGVGTTDFDISEKQKSELIDSGKQGASIYFDWLSDPKTKTLPD